ncbi:hypothetical protein ACQRWP_20775 [Micromonospora trifolii]|uniref:hypothetical protein n=1 Tax=Micromonospora trifolii TaxID=2911208 RepID=UPI003D2EBC4F
MPAQSWVALMAAVIAATVAVTIPVWTFRNTIKQERQRWIRDQRGVLYIDILTEAQAELRWVTNEMKIRPDKSFVDMRTSRHDRARLGARISVFSTADIHSVFDAFQERMAELQHVGPEQPADIRIARLREAENTFSALEEAIRTELETR